MLNQSFGFSHLHLIGHRRHVASFQVLLVVQGQTLPCRFSITSLKVQSLCQGVHNSGGLMVHFLVGPIWAPDVMC